MRCSVKIRTCHKITIFRKQPKMTCRVKKVCSEFESNLCNIIITSLKEVIFVKICLYRNMLISHHCRRS